jgi:DNA-binding GntR family transcriptional regulator
MSHSRDGGDSRASLRQKIHDRLREQIFRGELEPGTRLSPPELARDFGVSTMPVREALRLLGEEGLVEVSPRKWTRVTYPDPNLLDEIYPIVATLERFALSTVSSVPVEVVNEAREANSDLADAAARHDVVGCTEADDRFHTALVNLNPNETLRRTIAALKARTRLLESAYYRLDDASESVQQHAEIIDALIRNDVKRAGEIVAANWEMGHAKLRAAFTGH